MILHANREMDARFVARVLKEHKLSPVPLAGFHAEATYWQETVRFRRVVERYPWGIVLFASDRERDEHVTAVVLGKVDLSRGRSLHKAATYSFPVPWYGEMVGELVASPPSMTIPACVGFHEADHVCDGGTNPQTGEEERPCAWRERCIAIQSHAGEASIPVEDLLKSRSPGQIHQLATHLLERGEGLLSAPPPACHRPETVGSASSSPHLEPVIAIVEEVAELVGAKLAPDRTAATAATGDLYFAEQNHGLAIAVFQVPTKPRRYQSPLIVFRSRGRRPGWEIKLPLKIDHPLLSGIVQADLRQAKDGWCLVREVISGQRRMDHVRVALAAIIRGEHVTATAEAA